MILDGASANMLRCCLPSRLKSIQTLVELNPKIANISATHYPNIGSFSRQFRKLKLVQACLRAPHVVADEAKMAIVGPGGLRVPCVAWPLLSPLFGPLFSLSFFFSLRLLLFTHFGESPVCENLFPQIFWHN